MSRCYPCDSSGVCPYETWDNPNRMYFCRDNCGMGVDDDEPYIEEDEFEDDTVDTLKSIFDSIEWVSMNEMIAWGVDKEVADCLTAMGQPQIQRDAETDEMYCEGVLSWHSVEEFVKDVNEHKEEILKGDEE